MPTHASVGEGSILKLITDFGDTTDIEGNFLLESTHTSPSFPTIILTMNASARSLTLLDPLSKSQSTSFLSLPNGCLCCSVKDLGIAAIEEMVASQAGGVDWVVVELTGVANPGTLTQ